MSRPPSDSDLAGLQLSHQEYMAAYNRGNAAGVASLFTQNAQLFPAHTGVVANRQAIQAFWQGTMDLGIRSILLETQEAEAQRESCTEIGRYTFLGGKGQVLDTGKYIAIWKKVNGTWFLHRYIWTTSLPAPGPSPGN
jgi:ketosteroid isomerase-like protein